MSDIDAMRRDGIVFARTAEGFELPVLDVTQPRFALAEDPESLEALHQALVKSERERRWIPGFALRFMLKLAARRSRLVKAMFAAKAPVLDGLTTYVMKLGSDNLVPPYDTAMDRNFAAAPHAIYMRLRTQQMAELLAGGLRTALAGTGNRPLRLINIAGGPAIDSLNALILLHSETPALLKRRIAIDVLDPDDAGAFFGRNALVAMLESRLRGAAVTFTHRRYDWNDTGLLEALISECHAEAAVVAVTSEGGLFEYGSDAAIVANLQALRANGQGARLVVGSVTRDDDTRRRLLGATRFAVIPRGISGIAPLVARGGFAVGETRPTVWSDQVALRLL